MDNSVEGRLKYFNLSTRKMNSHPKRDLEKGEDHHEGEERACLSEDGKAREKGQAKMTSILTSCPYKAIGRTAHRVSKKRVRSLKGEG